MQTLVGIWIDHQEAVIVESSEAGLRSRRIQSQIQRQGRRAGRLVKARFSARTIPADDVREREYQSHLARYYDEIIAHVRADHEVMLFSPGEAKVELEKRFARVKGCPLIRPLETADRMTEPQTVAHVRQSFHQTEHRWRGPVFMVSTPLTQTELC